MADFVDVTITVKVTDAQALWRKARDYLIDCGNLEEGSTGDDVIGSEDEPDAGACLIMLLDRSEHLDGAEIENSTAYSPPLLDFDDDEDDEPCRQCGAVPGTPEYGTTGDGFDGLCPSCADQAEPSDDETAE